MSKVAKLKRYAGSLVLCSVGLYGNFSQAPAGTCDNSSEDGSAESVGSDEPSQGINCFNKRGFNLLMLAVAEGCEGQVRVLLEMGADPLAPNEAGVSALSIALQNGDSRLVKLLSDWHIKAPQSSSRSSLPARTGDEVYSQVSPRACPRESRDDGFVVRDNVSEHLYGTGYYEPQRRCSCEEEESGPSEYQQQVDEFLFGGPGYSCYPGSDFNC